MIFASGELKLQSRNSMWGAQTWVKCNAPDA